jgi:hypothetical protein
MKQTGEITLFNATLTQAVVNTYYQVAIPTGLSTASNDAFLVIGAQLEMTTNPSTGSRREAAFVRASRAAMPSLTDDDVLLKHSHVLTLLTSGMADVDTAPQFSLPPQAIVVVEANVYFCMKTLGEPVLQTYNGLLWVERVELTDKEKTAILSSRLNNLLN